MSVITEAAIPTSQGKSRLAGMTKAMRKKQTGLGCLAKQQFEHSDSHIIARVGENENN